MRSPISHAIGTFKLSSEFVPLDGLPIVVTGANFCVNAMIWIWRKEMNHVNVVDLGMCSEITDAGMSQWLAIIVC